MKYLRVAAEPQQRQPVHSAGEWAARPGHPTIWMTGCGMTLSRMYVDAKQDDEPKCRVCFPREQS